MMALYRALLFVVFCLVLSPISFCKAFSNPTQNRQTSSTVSALQLKTNKIIERNDDDVSTSRRSFFISTAATLAGSSGLLLNPSEANAVTDCFKDCVKNCKLIAPKDPQYCENNCTDYCAQEDRTDGLSGSVSSTGGEVGILGINTVPKGEDKPPQVKLPGLDFSSGGGKKLIGY